MSNMEKANLVIEVKHFVNCPHCHNSKSRIDHLFGDMGKEVKWGPWYCEKCGNGYKGVVRGRDVFVEKANERIDNSIVFLKYGNILLAVKGVYFNGQHDSENDRYYYEEGTCPVNYFRSAEMVIDLENGDKDPHGLFEFIGSIPYVDLDKVEDVRTLIPAADAVQIRNASVRWEDRNIF
jgi:hypothetical protein